MKWRAPPPEFTATQPEVTDWPLVPSQQFLTEDWNAQLAAEDWSASLAAQATEWVGTRTEWF